MVFENQAQQCRGAYSAPNRLNHGTGRGKPAPTLDGVVALHFQRPLAHPQHESWTDRLKPAPLLVIPI